MSTPRTKLAGIAFALITIAAVPSSLTAWRAPEGEALARLESALAKQDSQYDDAEHMIRRPFSTPGYHTELKQGFVHPTRDSLSYALGLLDTGKPERLERAVAILRRVVALQDSDATSRSFGIWSWYLEEPLSTMKQPDFNWADFNGVTLLQVSRDHRARLPSDLAAHVDAAILRACAAIRKRDVGPGYTNIAIMGAYVTLVAGEHLGAAEYREYGLARLHRLYAHTLENGAFEEYNSPTYTIIAVQELSRLKAHVREVSAHPLIDDLLRRAWEDVATHFHAPTRQWAGPQSRAYSSLVRQGTLALIQRASGGAVNFDVDAPEPDELRLPLSCPADLVPLFRELSAPLTVTNRFIKRSDTVGTTYLHPNFALGTINHGDLWNQRRALLLHYGDARRPGYLHLRLLKDDYDFASAQLISAQRDGMIIGAVNLVTDGGDTHITLDMVKNARFRARDLRVRFELGGEAAAAAHITTPADGHPAAISVAGLDISLAILRASLDGRTGEIETGQDDLRRWLDVVLYRGDAREFDLAAIADAIVAFGFSVGPLPAIDLVEVDERLRLAAADLHVEAAVRPRPRQWDDSFHAPLGSGGGYR